MDLSLIYELANLNSGMTDIERLGHLEWAVSGVLQHCVRGDVVEVGCNAGYTSVFLTRLLDEVPIERRPRLHVFDSFKGLPARSDHDEYLSEGELAVGTDVLMGNFERFGLVPPVVHEGWFSETLPSELPDEIGFAYIDGDFYESTMVALEHVVPRLSPGAVAILDDYCDQTRSPRCWMGLPGVKQAVDDYAASVMAPTWFCTQALAGVGDLSFGVIRVPTRP